MLSSSSKPWGDFGDNLSNFFEEIEAKDRQEKLDNEIRQLRQTLKSVKLTEEKLIKQIAEKDSSNSESPTKGKGQKSMSDKKTVEAIDLKQKLELYSICQSLSCLRSDEPENNIIFNFHPAFQGKAFGPYQVCLETIANNQTRVQWFRMPIPGDFACQTKPQTLKESAKPKYFKQQKKMPYTIVPIEDLQKHHLECAKPNVQKFILAVRICLSSYISRLSQVMIFRQRFGNQFFDLQYDDDVTKISFGLKIDDVGDEQQSVIDAATPTAKTIVLRLSLSYELNSDLPRKGGLNFHLENDGAELLGEDGVQDLKDQCEMFYTKHLEEAVNEAFGDD